MVYYFQRTLIFSPNACENPIITSIWCRFWIIAEILPWTTSWSSEMEMGVWDLHEVGLLKWAIISKIVGGGGWVQPEIGTILNSHKVQAPPSWCKVVSIQPNLPFLKTKKKWSVRKIYTPNNKSEPKETKNIMLQVPFGASLRYGDSDCQVWCGARLRELETEYLEFIWFRTIRNIVLSTSAVFHQNHDHHVWSEAFCQTFHVTPDG